MPRSEEDIRNCLHRHNNSIANTSSVTCGWPCFSILCDLSSAAADPAVTHPLCSHMTAATDQVGCSSARLSFTLHTILAYNWTPFRTISAIILSPQFSSFVRIRSQGIRYLAYVRFFLQKGWKIRQRSGEEFVLTCYPHCWGGGIVVYPNILAAAAVAKQRWR